MKSFLATVLRVLCLLLLLALFFNGRPPAMASPQSANDAVQDEKITQLDQHIKQHEVTDDARVQQLSRDMQGAANQISEMRGEERGLFGALAILQILAIASPYIGKRRSEK